MIAVFFVLYDCTVKKFQINGYLQSDVFLLLDRFQLLSLAAFLRKIRALCE